MVKANFSFGGKLLLVLLTVIIYTFVLVGGVIGGALYAYNNVKVGDLLSLLQQSQWVSEEYAQKTINEFVKELQKDLSGEGLTLQKIIDISPKAGETMDEVLDNLNENGFVTIDRKALYNTPVQELSASIKDVAVVTATLSTLQEKMGVTLPDLPIISGGDENSGAEIYTVANDTEDGSLDKAFLFAGNKFTYYTKATAYAEATVTQTLNLYTPAAAIAEDVTNGYLTADGSFIYRRTGTADLPEYTRIRGTSSAVYQSEDGTILFKTDELYTRTGLGDNDYSKLAFQNSTPQELHVRTVKNEYLYQPLFADAEGKTPATGAEPDINGRYPVLDEYKGERLYAATDKYDAVAEENLKDGFPTDEFLSSNKSAVYVRSDGLSTLPLLNAVTALSGVLDMNSLSLKRAADYFGISLGESDLLKDIVEVPLAHLGSGTDEAVQNLELGAVLGLKKGDSEFLLFLAYGDPENYTFDENGEVVMNPGAKKNTVADISNVLDTVTIGNIVGESSHPLMQTIGDWTLDDFANADKLNGLTIGDLMEIDENASETAAIILALKDISIGELSTAIDDLTVEDMLGTIDEGNNILYALRNCTLENMASTIATLSLQDLFADQIYGTDYFKANEGGAVNSAYMSDDYGYVHLYVKNGESYVLATQVTKWALPAGAPQTQYYTKNGGSYVAVTPESGTNLYGYPALYYLDKNSDERKEIELVPARIDFIGGYNAETAYYSPFTTANKTGDVYENANLYYFDIATESFVRISNLDSVTKDGTENSSVIGYKLNGNSLPEGMTAENTVIFTRGEVQGIWKYLLTNEDKTEIIASLNGVGDLLENISSNLTTRTLNEMYADKVLQLDNPEVLNTKIPSVLPSAGKTLGEMTVSGLLNLTSQALQMLGQISGN